MKITLYFSRIDNKANRNNNEDNSDMTLRDMINKILNEYASAKNEKFAGNPMGKFIRNEAPQILLDTGIFDENEYLIEGSVGQGNWVTVPWIAILDSRITSSVQEGEYIVYLLSADGESLYLTFNQGCTKVKNEKGTVEARKLLKQKAIAAENKMDARGFLTDDNINLRLPSPSLTANLYEPGTMFYKEYKRGEVPKEDELLQDLENMKLIYQDYYEQFFVNEDDANEPEQVVEEEMEDKTVGVKDTIENIEAYIASKGYTYEKGLIENFYLSLKSKPFVILAGISGTGKTRLVRLFAEAVGATAENGRYKMVPVRPDWSDSSDLFGHVDLNGTFIPGVIIDFVKTANDDLENPYFLCLDEMNLARVEYYLSDILSVIETREKTDSGSIISDTLIPPTFFGSDIDAAKKYGALTLPENLYIIGTVNMDETTFPFSRKVLDRANTIEFSYVNLKPEESPQKGTERKPIFLDNEFFRTEYLLLDQCKDDWEDVTNYCNKLEEINKILEEGGAKVGYRVRDEIVFYLLNNKKGNLLSEDDAFDNELMQKILPRIQGDSFSVKEMLCDLFNYCVGDSVERQTQSDDISSEMDKVLDEKTPKYKHSAEKIAFMTRRFEEDGFTSYWL